MEKVNDNLLGRSILALSPTVAFIDIAIAILCSTCCHFPIRILSETTNGSELEINIFKYQKIETKILGVENVVIDNRANYMSKICWIASYTKKTYRTNLKKCVFFTDLQCCSFSI